MALHSLSLTDGTTTVSLATSSVYLLDYVPRTPVRKNDEWQDVTESATVMVQAATSALAQAAINSIEKLLRQAEERQPNTGSDRVFVTYQMSSDASAWRSEILAGRVELNDDAWRHWNTKTVEALVIWTRRYYWEGVEAEIDPEFISTGGNVVNDGGTGLWIPAAEVTGVIPAPVRLEMTNDNGISVSFRRFFLSLNVFADPGEQFDSAYHILEGEAATSVSAGGSDVSLGTCRGGAYKEMAWTGSATHAGNFMNWTLTAAMLASFGGERLRLLVRLPTAPAAGTYIKLALKIPAGATPLTTIWESGEILLNTTYLLQDLGTIRLPPVDLSASDEMALILSVRSETTGVLRVDFLALLATDGLHTFEQIGYAIPANGKIIADGIATRSIYYQSTAGKQLSIYSDNPPGLHVWPGRDQALEMLYDEGSTMVITRTLLVRIYYRPRRLTV
jgi:hypothetical protein